MPIAPMNEVPGSTGNDVVTNYQEDLLYVGQPLDVQTYLNVPGNMGDTTQVQISWSGDAVPLWSGRLVYATEYLDNFYAIYPNLATG